MKYASVCSGIEAPTMAWHALGWYPQWFSEIAPFPSAVLAHHYPTVPNLGDMTQFKQWGIKHESIDLLVGGTPCQSFSVAGLRKGLADPRGNLALVFLAIAHAARARWVVWENVPGVLSSNRGRDFGAFLGALVELGYGFAYRVLDAQYYGVPQRRRRVFVVGYLGDWRPAAAVLFERDSLSGNPAPSREAGQGVAATLTRSALDGSSACGGDGRDGLMVASTLSARTSAGGGLGTDFDLGGGVIVGAFSDGPGQIDVAHALRGEGFDASEDGSGRGTPLVPIAFDTTQITSTDNRCNPQPCDPCHPLAANAHAPAIAFDCKASGRNGFGVGGVSPTLRAMGRAGSHANAGGQVAIASTMAVRRLTPRECERLQGFPDDYTLAPYRGKPAADGPRYKALGNSMAVPVMRWIGERIAAVLPQ